MRGRMRCASVRIDGRPGPDGRLDIAKADQLPEDMLVTGTEVHSRIRCGNRAMGYSLFYGLWEFVYEKIEMPVLADCRLSFLNDARVSRAYRSFCC